MLCVFIYQNKTCVQTLEGHAQNVTCVRFHPGLPIILTGSEDGKLRILMKQFKTTQTRHIDIPNQHSILVQLELFVSLGTVRVWHSNTYRLENTLNYGLERVWCICGQPGSNSVAFGYDEGSIIIKVYCVLVLHLHISQKVLHLYIF